MSIWYVFGLNIFALAYGSVIATFGLLVLPSECEYMFAENQALMLGFFMALAGISQLSGPLAGFFSDRCIHRIGRRKPYMLGGCLVGCLGLLIQYFARSRAQPMTYLYFIAFFGSMLGLNVIYVAFSGALADIVPAKQMGQANGILGGFTVLGASLGFGAFTLFLSIEMCYYFFAVVLAAGTIISCWFMNEKPLLQAKPWKWADIVLCYYLSPTEHTDFFMVFVSRTLYYMAVSIQTFMLFYFRDMIQGVDGKKDAQDATSYLALIGQLSGAVVCYPMGLMSDRFGRKPLIFLSSSIIVFVYVMFMFTSTMPIALVGGAIYGIGNGTYLAVDYALASDVLPSKKHAARFMGIWGVAAFIGTMVGPLMIGPLLMFFGSPSTDAGEGASGFTDSTYTRQGYIVIMLTGCICMIGSGLT
eukprot:Pgem_evm1s18337